MAQLVDGKLVGRLAVNVNGSSMPLKRKRVQPRGSRDCPDCGRRTISANKDRCKGCADGLA